MRAFFSFLAISGATLASAQIVSTLSTYSSTGAAANITSENILGNILEEPELFQVKTVGSVSYRANLDAGTSVQHLITTRGHLRIGSLPIRITRLDNFHTVLHAIGGGSGTNPTSRTLFSTRLYAYTDVNQNGNWEEDEPRSSSIFALGEGSSGTVVRQVGNGTNSSSTFSRLIANYTMATNADYFLETQILTQFNTNAAITQPPVPTLLHKFDTGNAYSAQVSYVVVPEPMTLAVFGLGSALLIRVRRRS